MRPALLVALIFGGASTLEAQIEWVGTAPRIGIIAGFNESRLVGRDAQAFEQRNAAMAGAMLIKPFSNGVSVESGIGYSMKGAATRNEFGTAAVRIDFVEVPLLARYDFRVESDTRPFVTAGGAVAFRASCEIDASDGFQTYTGSCEEADRLFADGTAEFQRVDGSLVAGAGVAFDVGGRILTVGVRYSFGLTNFTSESDSRHRVRSILATFEWPLRRP